jgi:YfiH family protein
MQIPPHFSNLIPINGGIPHFRFPGLSRFNELVHGVFSRLGGVSRPPFESLNTSYGVGDRSEDVRANLEMIRREIGARRILLMNQCHSDTVEVDITRASYDERTSRQPPSADGLITQAAGVSLLVRQADCQAVIVFDPRTRIVGNFHCGWRGNVANILERGVRRMQKASGARPQDLHAAIGPSLGPCCAEFRDYRELFPSEFMAFMVADRYFNLWELSIHQLVAAGLRREHIEIASVCTRCNTELFFSFRGEGRTGRFGTVAMLKPTTDLE